ncbi:MAG: hypothetical protein GXO58_03185 [Thermodesulfobacteria bacterium]|nr:hypothetical protein [Thermodesulfobacteriota bacterium]
MRRHSFLIVVQGGSVVFEKNSLLGTSCNSVFSDSLSIILNGRKIKIDFFFQEEFCSLLFRIKSDIDSMGYMPHTVVFACFSTGAQQKEILDSFETTRV